MAAVGSLVSITPSRLATRMSPYKVPFRARYLEPEIRLKLVEGTAALLDLTSGFVLSDLRRKSGSGAGVNDGMSGAPLVVSSFAGVVINRGIVSKKGARAAS